MAHLGESDRIEPAVIDWLLAGDPAIRWQVMRDLLDAPREQWQAERARVEHEGWGAHLLAQEDEDGRWAGGACFPSPFSRELFEAEGQPWTSTLPVLHELMVLGLDPATDRARDIVSQVGANARWEYDDLPFWGGEVEECINGRTVALGCYFGAGRLDMAPLVERLVSEQQPDGGWNCERANGSTRSSFHSTINVLEGLLEFERSTAGTPESQAAACAARAAGEDYLLQRHLFRRLSTGVPAADQFLRLTFPPRWHYTTLRALDYLRAAAALTHASPDPRAAEAVEQLRARRDPEGRWPLDHLPRGRVWQRMEEPGMPSRWVTLEALRILRWWES